MARRSPAHAPLALRFEVLEARTLLTVPGVLAINRSSPTAPITNQSSVAYSVTFSEPVTGVSAGSFRATTTSGLAVSDPIAVGGSGASYTVTLTGVHGAGDLRLDLIDDDSIQNAVLLPLGGLGAGNGSFHGQAYVVDQEAPFVASITRGAPASASTGASIVSFTVTFSKPVTGVDRTDFQPMASGGVSASTLLSVWGSGAVYTVTLTDVAGSGSLWLKLLDDRSIRDLAGNGLIDTGAPLAYQGQTPVAAGLVPVSVATGDINDDGKADLVVANFLSQNLSVMLGNGDGTFSSQTPIATASNPQSVAIEDLNGDGKRDLAIANFNTNTIGVMLGNGDGTFGAQTTFATGTNPQSIVAADFNADGKVDLAVANSAGNTLSVLLGNGDGTFQAQVANPAGTNPHGVAACDFNSDGKIDLVATAVGSGAIAVMLGNGDGTFAAPVNYATGSDPECVAVADVNNDGTFDVVVDNPPDNNVSVLLGIGDGTFAPQTTVATGSNPQCVVTGDVNLDGKIDLIVPNYDDGNVGILLGNGDGTFAAMAVFGTGSTPQDVAVGDFNGDGPLDLAVPSFLDGSVSVILSSPEPDFEGDAYAMAAPTHMAFATPPATTLSGAPLAAPAGVQVAMLDVGDNVVTDNNATVTLTLIGGTFAGGATTVSAPVVGGIATFGSLVINTPGNYTLRASAGGLPPVTSSPFTISPSAAIVGRRLFYRGSTKWNVTNANLPGFSDDNAIAPDKSAYLPGAGTSTFSNVSGYTKGINGLMVDLSGPHGAITASDFQFRAGNNNSPGLWATAAAPLSVTVRPGAGSGGSDRVELIWADGIIQKTWLEVTVRGNDIAGGWNSNSGLPASDKFYFGSAVGDGGADDLGGYLVSSADEIQANSDPHGLSNPAPITNVNDHNRDGLVNSADQIAVRSNVTSIMTQLKFLNAPVPPTAGAGGPYYLAAGQPLTVSGVGTDPDPFAVLTYSWDVNGDGIFGDAVTSNPTLSWAQLGGLGIAGPAVINNVRVRVSDGTATTTSAPTSLLVLAPGFVVDRKLFYLRSPKWNVTNANLPGFSDDNAIAPDKSAYLPGAGSSTFANVSGYNRGVNGIMVDLFSPHGAITANDFVFKAGNNNSPSTWATAAGPTSVIVRSHAGANGSDRVELLWADNAISGVWLEVIVRGNDSLGSSNTNLGLNASDVFFFGSAPGDTGASDASAFSVTSADEIAARNNPHGIGNPATIGDPNDLDRDGLVNSSDQVIARNLVTGLGNQLKFLVVDAGGPFAPDSSAAAISATSADPGRAKDRQADANLALAAAVQLHPEVYQSASRSRVNETELLSQTAVANFFESLGLLEANAEENLVEQSLWL